MENLPLAVFSVSYGKWRCFPTAVCRICFRHKNAHIRQAEQNILIKEQAGKGVFILNVEEMKRIDVTKVNRADLVDVKDVSINRFLNQERQINDFVSQIKNPYCYKYGDFIVKIGFENTEVTLTDRLKELVLKTANSV